MLLGLHIEIWVVLGLYFAGRYFSQFVNSSQANQRFLAGHG